MIVVAAVVLVFVPLPLPVVASSVEALGFVVSRCLFPAVCYYLISIMMALFAFL